MSEHAGIGDNATRPEPDSPRPLVCRCEEILDEEIIAALIAGARTMDDVKRRTRAGMGACQGIYCMPTIAAMVSQATGRPVDSLAPMTERPPARPVPLEALANLQEVGSVEIEARSRETSE